MSLFEQLVSQALKSQDKLSPLRVMVEKELLHHDILREMSTAGLLHGLTFIGGTCLRACYGSSRLSEDLDFTGGKNFERETLAKLGEILIERLHIKYNLKVVVSEPVKDTGNVDTWKLKVTTRPRQTSLPLQRIHIDICAIPSYDQSAEKIKGENDLDIEVVKDCIMAWVELGLGNGAPLRSAPFPSRLCGALAVPRNKIARLNKTIIDIA